MEQQPERLERCGATFTTPGSQRLRRCERPQDHVGGHSDYDWRLPTHAGDGDELRGDWATVPRFSRVGCIIAGSLAAWAVIGAGVWLVVIR